MIEQRVRFAAEVVREVRRVIGPDRPLIIRLIIAVELLPIPWRWRRG